MSDSGQQAAGWYYAQGDPPGTQRYWDGTQWQGGPQPVAGGAGFPGGAATGAGQPLSSPGKRVGARIIDALITGIIGGIISTIVFGVGLNSSTDFTFDTTTWAATLVGTLIVLAYETWFVANKGATPGKMALGMKVIRQDGAAMDINTAAKRIALYAVAIIPVVGGGLQFLIGLVGFILIFSDKARQAVWDKFAGTVVVDG